MTPLGTGACGSSARILASAALQMRFELIDPLLEQVELPLGHHFLCAEHI